jgi:hypothetical protein
LSGGGPQIAVEGGPKVDLLEEWDEKRARWVVSWARRRPRLSQPLDASSP